MARAVRLTYNRRPPALHSRIGRCSDSRQTGVIVHRTLVYLAALIAMAACTTLPASQTDGRNSMVADRVKLLTRASQWRPMATVPIGFNTHHPQGMVKIGDTFFVTAVEIRTPTKRYAQPQ